MYSNKVFKSASLPKTQEAPLLQQPVTDAIQSILSTKKGERCFDKILELSDNLVIRQSGLGEKAGKGLFIVAKNGDLRLKAETPVTFYNGTIRDYVKTSLIGSVSERYTIGLGSTLKAASKIIISDPEDTNPVGSAHFANHSTVPNCKLSYLYGDYDVIAVLIVMMDDTFIAKDHALELVFDYGASAEIIHGIKDLCDYTPHIKPMSHFDEEDYGEFFMDNHQDIVKARSDRLAQHLREKQISIEQKFDASQKLLFLAEKSLPKNSFSIIDSSDDDAFSNLLVGKESNYFIKIYPHDIRWILMHVVRGKSRKNTVYLFDPEGDLGSKVLSQWFFGLDLTNTTFNFIHSKSIDEENAEAYGATHVSCVALARVMLKGIHNGSVSFNAFDSQTVLKMGRVTRLLSKAIHSNIQLKSNDPLSTLTAKILTHYPEHAQMLSIKNKRDIFLAIIALLQSDSNLKKLKRKDVFLESSLRPFHVSALENVMSEKKRGKIEDHDECLFHVLTNKEKKMPKLKVEPLLPSADKYLAKESFAVIDSLHNGVFIDLLSRKETFYFIKTFTTGQRWILMYVNRIGSENNIYFFDPEGTSIDTVLQDWFLGLDLKTIKFHFIRSWFVYDLYSNGYANTDLICVGLAQVLQKGLNQFSFEKIPDAMQTNMQQFPSADHYNIKLNFQDALSIQLSQLLVAYPDKSQSLRHNEVKDILSDIRTLLSQKPASTGVEEPISTGVEEPISTGVEEPISTGVEEPISTGVEEPISMGVEEPISTGVEEPISMGVEEPISMGVEEPISMGVEEPISAGVEESASAGVEESASAGVEESASAGVEESASAGVEASVSAGVEASVSAGVEASVSAGVEASVSAGVEASASAGVDASASAGVDASASAGVDASASAGVDASALAGVEEPALKKALDQILYIAEEPIPELVKDKNEEIDLYASSSFTFFRSLDSKILKPDEPVCKRGRLEIDRHTLLDFLLNNQDKMQVDEQTIRQTIEYSDKAGLDRLCDLCNTEAMNESNFEFVERGLKDIYKEIDSTFLYD